MRRIQRYKPKETLFQFPTLWLPGSPLPSSRGLGRRCCCDEGQSCVACLSGIAPDQVSVTISGLVDPGASCECEVLNDTFILDFSTFPIPNSCLWDFQFGECHDCNSNSGFDALRFLITPNTPTSLLRLEVVTFASLSCQGGVAHFIDFRKPISSKPDCEGFSAVDIPNTLLGSCNGTATCSVTSL